MRKVAAMLVLGWTAAYAGVAQGQNFPSRTIRIVTPGTGGGGDFTGRLIAQGLSGDLGQQVIVDNRPSGVIPGDIVSKSPPDGYTLLVSANTLWVGALFQPTPYDPVKDFAPITLAVMTPNILFTHPSLPVKSVRYLIALAKSRPDALNYSSGSTGSPSYLAGELFKYMAGVKIVNIPYKSHSLETNDLIAGQVQLAFSTPAAKMELVKSGRLRALAVTSARPSALFPELPTIAAAGLPGYESVSVYGFFAPAHTPEPIISRLNQEIVRVLKNDEIKDRFFKSGSETVGSSAEQFSLAIKTEMTQLGKLIKATGMHAE